MRKLASEVLISLETRVARLEKQAEHDDQSIADLRKYVERSSLSKRQKKEVLLAFDKSALNYKASRLKREAQDITYNASVVEGALKNLGEREIQQLINFFGG